MTRTFAIAAILSLTIAGASAETLTDQVHTAALKACAVESSASLPASHYGAITQACVDRISAATLRKLSDEARAKTLASTASAN